MCTTSTVEFSPLTNHEKTILNRRVEEKNILSRFEKISNRFKDVSTIEEFRAVLNEIAKEKEISIIDTSKFGEITSAEDYLAEAKRIAEYVKKRGVGLYFVERANLFHYVFNNNELLKKLKENVDIFNSTNEILLSAENPTPKDEFFTASSIPANILSMFERKGEWIEESLGLSPS